MMWAPSRSVNRGAPAQWVQAALRLLPKATERGFTLVELLVTIAIISVLMCLLLPAVQQAREASRRMSCANNLKELGLGLHQFHDTHNAFPPGNVQGPYAPAGVYWNAAHGWAVFILPYIEQGPLYDSYHWDQSIGLPVNATVVACALNTFICPSTPERNRFDTTHGQFPMYGTRGACGDYAPTWSVAPALGGNDLRGVLVPMEMTALKDIIDGSSSTIMLTEDAGRPRLWHGGHAGPDQVVAGGPWAGFNTGITLTGSQPGGTSKPGPCALNCTNDHEFYSFHPGGANALFADGHVRFLKTGTNVGVLAALVTRAGTEIVSTTNY
jgi:prepilin-type N-terminal cleavage/methylation domain-containing protein/prepilin-type processing-associated H-X9-DG protein